MAWLTLLLTIIQFVLSLFANKTPTAAERKKMGEIYTCCKKFGTLCDTQGIPPVAESDLPYCSIGD